jgi:hypothetical protein
VSGRESPIPYLDVVLNPATARALGCTVPSHAGGEIEVLP